MIGVTGKEIVSDETVKDVICVTGRIFTLEVNSNSQSQLDLEINETGDVNDETKVKPQLQEVVAVGANLQSSGQTSPEINDISNLGDQVEVEQEINKVSRAGGSMAGRSGRVVWWVTAGRSGDGRGTSVREATAMTIADGVGSGADALRRMIPVIRNKAILAAEVARLGDVADGLAVFRVVALLVARLAVDEVGEEVVSLIFTTEQVGNVACNRVGLAEIGKDRQAQAEVKMTGD